MVAIDFQLESTMVAIDNNRQDTDRSNILHVHHMKTLSYA